jgi:hypothetical protein
MSQTPDTFALMGGLDLVSAPISIPPGAAVAACNYEPDDQGYTRILGYERYDGRAAPSTGVDTAAKDALRALIEVVPGTGPVRGVWVYNGFVWAFRDTGGNGVMYKATSTGWEAVVFGSTMAFSTGTVQFTEGEIVTGGTSGATAQIKREATQSGAYDGTATGYLTVYNITGTFVTGEIITDGVGGSATMTTLISDELKEGGTYRFVNHNFYGSSSLWRMYFCNGVGTAYEFDGEFAHAIHTGSQGASEQVIQILNRFGDDVINSFGDNVVVRYAFDRPQYIGQYADHLFLGFPGGSLLNSSLGEPLEFRAVTGAGEIGVGAEITGLLDTANNSLVIFCRAAIYYITGTSSATFVKNTISSGAGAFPGSAQMMDEPIYLDDGGLRKLEPTQRFGDFRLGTLSGSVSPLLDARLDADDSPVCSLRIRRKAQYRIFWSDGAGLLMFMGRRTPELMPIKLPIEPVCACTGELNDQTGKERVFMGGEDGFVYEMESGNSFDGAAVPAFVTLSWNTIRSPRLEKRFFMSDVEVDARDEFAAAVSFQVEYNRPTQVQGGERNFSVDAATRAFTEIANYADLTWTDSVVSNLYVDLQGQGTNVAVTIMTETTEERPHTFTAMTINYAPRKLKR